MYIAGEIDELKIIKKIPSLLLDVEMFLEILKLLPGTGKISIIHSLKY